MSKPKAKFRNVKLPTEMVEAIEEVIKRHPECAWRSAADFVRDAVRQLLWVEKTVSK